MTVKRAAMTDRPRHRGRLAVPLSAAAVTATATGAVAWAAATPPAVSSSPPPVVVTPATTDTYRASMHVIRAQRTLAEVRDDLGRLVRVHLPRAKVDHSLVAVSPGLPPAQVSIPAASPVVVPAVPAPAPPPPAHTSTGASGATRP